MFNLQGSEIIVILLLALVVLGPEKLPEAVRKFTKTYNEIKKMSNGFQSELKSALEEPMRELRETANLVRDAADPSKLMAEAEAEQRVLHDADVAEQAEQASDHAVDSVDPVDPVDPLPVVMPAAFAPPAPGSSVDGQEPPVMPGTGGIGDPGDIVATPGDPPWTSEFPGGAAAS